MNDEELSQLLRQSRPTIDFPQDFQREIWGRIEAAELQGASSGSVGWLVRWLDWLARPLPAVTLVLLMAFAGCLIALVDGQRDIKNTAETAYLKSVSPFAAAHLEPKR